MYPETKYQGSYFATFTSRNFSDGVTRGVLLVGRFGLDEQPHIMGMIYRHPCGEVVFRGGVFGLCREAPEPRGLLLPDITQATLANYIVPVMNRFDEYCVQNEAAQRKHEAEMQRLKETTCTPTRTSNSRTERSQPSRKWKAKARNSPRKSRKSLTP